MSGANFDVNGPRWYENFLTTRIEILLNMVSLKIVLRVSPKCVHSRFTHSVLRGASRPVTSPRLHVATETKPLLLCATKALGWTLFGRRGQGRAGQGMAGQGRAARAHFLERFGEDMGAGQ